MSFSTQVLLVCARDGLRRMPLHSLWNNPRRVHDHRALARIRESVVCGNADVSLKIGSGRRRRNLSHRRRINSHCGNLEKAQCNSRQSVLAQRAHCPPVENPVREALLSCSCRSASALLLFTFKAPAFVVPLSSTSTQLPPMTPGVRGNPYLMFSALSSCACLRCGHRF